MGPFSVAVWISGGLEGPISKHGFPEMTFFFFKKKRLGSISGERKHERLKMHKSSKRRMDRPKMHVYGMCFEEFASCPRKVSHKCTHFSKWAPSFLHCGFYYLWHGRKTKWAPRPIFGILGSGGGPQALLRIREPILCGKCVVCVCGAVCVSGKSHGVSNAC